MPIKGSSSFSIGFKTKIYGAMGSLCLLMAIVAGIALNIIADNLKISRELEGKSVQLSTNVVKVSNSIKDTLNKQEIARDSFISELGQQAKERSARTTNLYEILLSVSARVADVGRQSNLIINDGESYAVVAEEVKALKGDMDLFFNLPEMEAIDPKKVKKVKRASKMFLRLYDEVRELDEENVSMSQQMELIAQAMDIGKSLQKRMDLVVLEIKQYAAAHTEQEERASDLKMEQVKGDAAKAQADILKRQDEIKQTVVGNVEEIKSLQIFLLKNRNYLLIAVGVSLLIGIFFSIAIVKVISKPLIRAVSIAKGIAGGDLDQHVDITGDDEIGQLGGALEVMIEKLSSNRQELEASIVAIEEVSSSVAAAIEEISASMEEIGSMTSMNAEKAIKADGMSQTAKVNAEDGGVKVDEMVVAMQDVNVASLEITKIVKVISGIAFQTKLLALNAAVEAAHAGEMGLGFAVVAEEVRNLAARSQEAVEQTSALIDGPIKKITTTVEMAEGTAESFAMISQNVNGMTTLVNEIATASKEQEIGIKQTNSGLSSIEQSSQGLALQVDQLHQVMERFKCSNSENDEADTYENVEFAALPESEF